MMTTTLTRRFLTTLFGFGLLFCAELPGFSQPANQLIKQGAAAAFKKSVVPIPVIRPNIPLKGVRVSPVLGTYANEILRFTPAQQKALSSNIERQILSRRIKTGLYSGFYHPSNVDTRNVVYLQQVQKELSAIYPQKEVRFAPVTTPSLKELLQVWKTGAANEEFMGAGTAVEVLVGRAASRRAGYYALAVEGEGDAAGALRDILILDVNNARWLSLRKSLEEAAAKKPLK